VSIEQHRRALSLAGLVISLIVLIAWTCLESPKYPQLSHFGDDPEYLLMAQSFVRHHTPDYRPGDDGELLASLPRTWRNSLLKKYRPPRPSGYFDARDGKLIAWHFWSYPAAVAPIKAPLDRRDMGGRAFHVTNMLLFCAALLGMLQLWQSPRLWACLLPLAFFTPVLWFLPLAHTEPFIFSLGMLAVACYLRARRLLAILFAALAATQFQPLALAVFAVCAQSLWIYAGARWQAQSMRQAARKHALQIAASLVFASVALFPAIYYKYYFGVPSLVTREGYADSRLMSIDKLASMFIDLDTGMLVYLPGVLLLLALCTLLAARRSYRARSITPLLPMAVVIAILWSTTTARVWNYHTQGISRYALYTVPVMLGVIGIELKKLERFGWSSAIVLVATLGLQLVVHRTFGWFHYHGNDNLHHNQIALAVLERWPSLHAPVPEIFCSRTLHRRCWIDLETGYVTDEYLPAVLQDAAGAPRKALVKPCDPGSTLGTRPWTEAEVAMINALAADCRDPAKRGPRYIDFPPSNRSAMAP
jgi:hypothetical protein